MSDLQQQLESFRDEIPDFISTDLVNVESGLSIGGATNDDDFDASVASACYAELTLLNRQALDLLGLDPQSTEDLLITTKSVTILVRMLGIEYCHVLVITRKGNLGIARAIMKKYESVLLSAVVHPGKG